MKKVNVKSLFPKAKQFQHTVETLSKLQQADSEDKVPEEVKEIEKSIKDYITDNQFDTVKVGLGLRNK